MCVAAIDPLEPVTVWELERQVPEHWRHRERGLAENLSAKPADGGFTRKRTLS